MKPGSDGATPDPEWDAVDREVRRTRGQVLGLAVWRRLAAAAGHDPKEPRFDGLRQQVVTAIGAALEVMDSDGFEGLEEWLKLEEDFGG